MSIKFVKNEYLSFGSSNDKHLLLIGDNKDRGECYDGTKPEAWLKKNEPYGGALDVLEYVE